jgi:hypothetical protein
MANAPGIVESGVPRNHLLHNLGTIGEKKP